MASGSRGPEAAEAGFRVFLQDCSAAEPIAVSDLDGSMHWCQHALTQLCRHAGAKEICLRLSNGFSAYSNGTGVITTSTAFSGVGTPEVADEVIAATAATFLDNEWQDSWGERPQTPTFRCEFAVDKSTACQEELLVLPGGPKHVFENIAEFCPQECRRMYGLVKGTPAERDNSKLEEALLVTHRPKLRAGCLACGTPCLLRRCDVHTAGSPCTDHSTLGLQAKFAGKNAKHFYLWASLCKLLQHRLIVHENVKAFGVLELSGAFGDMYFLARTVSDVATFGWPIHRERQYCFLVHREWFFLHFMVDPAAQQLWDNERFATAFCFQSVIDVAFQRICNYTWHEFLFSEDDVLAEDMQWARARKDVKKRWEKAPRDAARLDKPDSPWAFLNKGERERYEDYKKLGFGREACDVGSDPTLRPKSSKDGYLQTLTAGQGLIVVNHGKHKRFMSTEELMASMGFPITTSQVAAASGVACQFSHGQQASALRSGASIRHATGNAMHLNAVGAAHLVAFILLGNTSGCQPVVESPKRKPNTRKGKRKGLSLAAASLSSVRAKTI